MVAKLPYEWDEAKNEANVVKHGISFDLASLIFDGPVFSKADNRKDYGESRIISIGSVENIVVLTVVHTDRFGKTRIISARRANRQERKSYEEALAKAAQRR